MVQAVVILVVVQVRVALYVLFGVREEVPPITQLKATILFAGYIYYLINNSKEEDYGHNLQDH